MYSQDLGTLGETEFKRLCLTAGGLTIHESQSAMDRTGWDFIIEFPFEEDCHLPYDLLSAPIECKVQVKSTQKKRRREYIELSNLIRLVKAQMPTFFCFIEFDDDLDLTDFYIVHVDREIIHRTLKKARELKSSGSQKGLNEVKIPISYGESDKLQKINGEELKRVIRSAVPDGLEKYIENKNELLRSIGFEDGRYELKVTITGSNPIKDILDVALRLREEVDVSESVGYHKRFGILSNTPEVRQGGTLSIQVKHIDASLKFREERRPLGISFNAKLYAPPFNQFISKELRKIRVESSFFDFVIELDKDVGDCSVHPFAQEKVCLDEVLAFLNLISKLQDSSELITVDVELTGLDSFPVFSFYPNDFVSHLLEMKDFEHKVNSWNDISDIARQMKELFNKLCISGEDIFFRFEDLLRLYQHQGFTLLHQAFCSQFESGTLLFSPAFNDYTQESRVASVFFANFCLGDCVVGCCLAITGALSSINNQNALIGNDILIGRQLIKARSDVTREQVEFNVNDLASELERSGEFALVTISF